MTRSFEGLVRVVAPVSEPVTLSETKAFLRMTHDEDNSRITDMIISARALAEQWLRRSLITQSWKLSYTGQLRDDMRLPMGPVQSISSVTCYDALGNATIIDSAQYSLSTGQDTLRLLDTVRGYRIEVMYVAGYGAMSDVPRPIKLGLLNHVASMVDGTIGLAPIPDGVLQYYTPYKDVAV